MLIRRTSAKMPPGALQLPACLKHTSMHLRHTTDMRKHATPMNSNAMPGIADIDFLPLTLGLSYFYYAESKQRLKKENTK